MSKRILAVILCVTVSATLFSACKKTPEIDASSAVPVVSEEEPVNKNKVNPLTGIQDLDPEYEYRKPVAVMVNNISTAQPVQTGLRGADIVYETEVEGGVTRLMAVFKNIEKADRIGPIRSARYPYIDLALGHDAAYIHCGQDPNYAAPHLYDIEDVSVETDYYAERIANGLAWEHTLYSYGSLLWRAVNEKCDTTTTSRTDPWQTFAAEGEELYFEGNTANTVMVPYDTAATFSYDSTTGTYIRYTMGSARTDYFTGETTSIKNLFVLNTTIVYYPDGVHRQVYLDGGDGWYIVNGTYTHITWRKGNSNDKMCFYDDAGNNLVVNQGNSWVCLINSSDTYPVFQ